MLRGTTSGVGVVPRHVRWPTAIVLCEVAVSVVCTTTVRLGGECAAFLGGFVAAEGSFGRSGRRFRFVISLGASDIEMCNLAAELIGGGHIYRYRRRRPHFQDEAVFVVQSICELVEHVVPFMDAYLPKSKKRRQYEQWKRQLLAYWNKDASRRRCCTSVGCSRPRRAKRLCRAHYYDRYRR